MPQRLFSSALIVACLALFTGSTSAAAAIVANGDFETGTLEAWTTAGQNPGHGEWSACGGESAPFPGPPSGAYAACSVVPVPTDATYLYQQVTLPAATTDRLSMYLYYRSEAPIAVPSPNRLVVSSEPDPAQPDQQVRVDVLKADAPVESMSPNDILATPYASRTGDPEELRPTVVTADLSALAGQTVLLRVADAAQQGAMEVGADDVAIESSPLLVSSPTAEPAARPSSAFVKSGLTLNRKRGTGTLAVTVPGAGSLTASDARRKLAVASGFSSAPRRAKPRPPLIRTSTVRASAAGIVKLPIRPTAAARKLLREKGTLTFRIDLSFAPTGGTVATQTFKGKLAQRLRRARR